MNATSAPSLGPFCQSCGMPLERPEDFGTSKEGFRVNDYCAFCFAKGAFTRPELTRAQVLSEIGRILAAKLDLAETEAKAAADRVAGDLKRWRQPARRAGRARAAEHPAGGRARVANAGRKAPRAARGAA